MTGIIEETTTAEFSIASLAVFKEKAFAWLHQFEVATYLDSNDYTQDKYGKYEGLIAAGVAADILQKEATNAFQNLADFHAEKRDWLFGFLSYDLKNDVEQLQSQNADDADFPELHFFQPTYVIEIFKETIRIHSKAEAPVVVFAKIMQQARFLPLAMPKLTLKARTNKADYLRTVSTIREHIQLGDIYEMNYCQAFYAEDAEVDAASLFWQLNKASKAPFSAFYKLNKHYILCASPERYMQKRGQQLISQPIKGTAKRGKTKESDNTLKIKLLNSKKDRSENVMIVDLVRNDLGRISEAGSVKVEELFGIYGFSNVWQMISTISGTLPKEMTFADALKATFPMGSMTGAPKVSSMLLIEKYEEVKRGIYAGAVGYITPDGDFDFNVVIRSLLYNAAKKKLSFEVGGAIVYDSEPEKEYEECLVKAANVFKTVNG